MADPESLDTIRLDVAIVGAGFAGLYALHRMRGAGLRAVVFEAADGVGGVWHWNRYPGARCDVESLQYSYSFSPELDQDWEWSERFAPQAEILDYANHVADRFDLRRDIRLGTRIAAGRFDEAANEWLLETAGGERVRARFCIMATGCLSVARAPDLPGLRDFAGDCFHTGAWPHTPVDFRNRRVALIGTGSSGIQATPVIAAVAGHLTVFQRTPNFIIPARNHPLEPDVVRAWKGGYPAHRARAKQVGTFYEFGTHGAMDVDQDERRREYERRWDEGGVNFVHAFKDIYLDQTANDTAAEFVRARVRELVTDPATAAALSPTDHPLGSKRICVASGYYEAFNRPNVTLVNLREEPIEAVVPEGIRTARGVHAVDTLVLATGYDAMTGALLAMDLRGRGGLPLRGKWADGPRNYLGLMTAGFPNLFTVTGPGSPSVLVNMFIAIEQHVDWITDCVEHLRAVGSPSIEPTEEAEDAWVEHVNAEADLTLFPRAASWYMGANIPGKARVFMPFVGGIARYRKRCDEVAANGYQGFELAPAAASATAPTAA